jgi:hypothetical protein
MKRVIITIGLLTIGFFNFMSCSDSEKKTRIQVDNTQPYFGARVIDNSTDLAICNETTKGQLFYVLDTAEFKYCDGTDYQVINLKGDQGEAGNQGIQGDQGIAGQDGASNTGLEVVDSTGALLGYLISSDMESAIFKIISPLGYIYNITWNGIFYHPEGGGTFEGKEILYYTSSDCSGIPNFYMENFEPTPNLFYGKKIYKGHNNLFYRPLNIDSNNMTTSIYKTSGSAFISNCTIASQDGYYLEVEETTKTACGIPETITPPLSIQF